MKTVSILMITCILIFATAVTLSGCSSSAAVKDDVIMKEEKNTARDYSDDSYNAEAAVEYALKFAEDRNLDYPQFENNCANYVSQCLVAGGLTMDDGKKAIKKNRRLYDDSPDLWYYEFKYFDLEKPPHFRITDTFVIVDSFLKYWTETRGYEIEKYDNTFGGRGRMLKHTQPGDVLIYYDTEENAAHMGVITGKDEISLYYSGNSRDRFNKGINELDNFVYPVLGILEIK